MAGACHYSDVRKKNSCPYSSNTNITTATKIPNPRANLTLHHRSSPKLTPPRTPCSENLAPRFPSSKHVLSRPYHSFSLVHQATSTPIPPQNRPLEGFVQHLTATAGYPRPRMRSLIKSKGPHLCTPRLLHVRDCCRSWEPNRRRDIATLPKVIQ
jgi:hypothetical protein